MVLLPAAAALLLLAAVLLLQVALGLVLLLVAVPVVGQEPPLQAWADWLTFLKSLLMICCRCCPKICCAFLPSGQLLRVLGQLRLDAISRGEQNRPWGFPRSLGFCRSLPWPSTSWKSKNALQ